jgi:hypothetical protein
MYETRNKTNRSPVTPGEGPIHPSDLTFRLSKREVTRAWSAASLTLHVLLSLHQPTALQIVTVPNGRADLYGEVGYRRL